MRIVSVLLVLLALTACAPRTWIHPTKTQLQANRDTYECQRDASMAAAQMGPAPYGGSPMAPGFALQQVGVEMEAYEDCLVSRGYVAR